MNIGDYRTVGCFEERYFFPSQENQRSDEDSFRVHTNCLMIWIKCKLNLVASIQDGNRTVWINLSSLKKCALRNGVDGVTPFRQITKVNAQLVVDRLFRRTISTATTPRNSTSSKEDDAKVGEAAAASQNKEKDEKADLEKFLVDYEKPHQKALPSTPDSINVLDMCICAHAKLDRRVQSENAIVAHIKSVYKDFQTIKYVSVGAGFLLQDWVIIAKLIKEGFTSFKIVLIDDETLAEEEAGSWKEESAKKRKEQFESSLRALGAKNLNVEYCSEYYSFKKDIDILVMIDPVSIRNDNSEAAKASGNRVIQTHIYNRFRELQKKLSYESNYATSCNGISLILAGMDNTIKNGDQVLAEEQLASQSRRGISS